MSGIINSAGSRSGVIGTTELDYEEGTFDPNLQTTGSSSTIAYAAQDGFYVKVGGLVTCWGWIMTGSSTWNGTYVQLGGLPFDADSDNQILGTVMYGAQFGDDTPRAMDFAASNRCYLMFRNASDGSDDYILAGDMSPGANKNQMKYQVTYKVSVS